MKKTDEVSVLSIIETICDLVGSLGVTLLIKNIKIL